MASAKQRVAIIGAGPYGLAAAAHLRAEGIEPIAFGEAMSFWERSMPVGMLLRSSRRASSIANPDRTLSLDPYESALGTELPAPLSLEVFVEYGHWFRRQVLPDLDARAVVRVDRAPDGFTLLLGDGEVVPVGRVVVAAGIGPFAHRPEKFSGLPAGLVSHASEVADVAAFQGRSVVVVGSGQSALEDAALLYEAGATVEVIARAPAIKWLQNWSAESVSPMQRRIRELMYPPTDVGPPGLNWIAGTPDVFRWLPKGPQVDIAARCIPPMGSNWLIARLAGVPLTLGRTITSVAAADGRVQLSLDDGSHRELDHVVLGTGYRVDVTRYGFLGPELLASLKLASGYPILTTGLESSVRGLHFLGAPAAATFGPVMRFVTGSWYCAPAVARKVAGRPPRAVRFAW